MLAARNHAARHIHNFLAHDGIDPRRFLKLGRADLAPYDVQIRRGLVSSARCIPGGFAVRVRAEERVTSRTLLLATGVVDQLPAIPNVHDFYGLGVHHCPYCDGWEYRNKPLAAYGLDHAGLGLALSLLTWSRDVTVLTNGQLLDAAGLATARRFGIKVRTEKITKLRSRRGRLIAATRDPLGQITFASGPDLEVAAMFFNTAQVQRSQLPKHLGCRMNEDGGVIHDRRQRTGIKGLYLAGDASFDVQFVVVAAAEGAKAGVAMNRHLQELDRKMSRTAGRKLGLSCGTCGQTSSTARPNRSNKHHS